MPGPRELDEILRVVVGSGLHGIAIEGLDDHDEMGIFIEPVSSVFGWKPVDHDVWRTQPEGHRSGPGDVDLVRYSLRKYLRLAVQGNPTILLPLFAPEDKILHATKDGTWLRVMRDYIVSKRAGARFLGYMQSQILRLRGEKQRHTNRPELIAKHGYDTKFASHGLRLALQGIELMRYGEITLPMRDPSLTWVRNMKEGKISFADATRHIESAEIELKRAVAESTLREEPDLDAITAWSTNVHLRHWT